MTWMVFLGFWSSTCRNLSDTISGYTRSTAIEEVNSTACQNIELEVCRQLTISFRTCGALERPADTISVLSCRLEDANFKLGLLHRTVPCVTRSRARCFS